MITSKYIRVALVALMMSLSPNVFATAGDTSAAVLNISGNVPAVFSVTARGLPGDLDLTPNSVVKDRLLGILHFKFNEDAASIKIGTDTATGKPEKAGTAYSFGAAFKVGYTGTCDSLDAATFGVAGGVALAQNPGTDYKSLKATDLATNNAGSGIEEDCQIVGNWGGTTSVLPLAGVYSMTITVTMVSNN
jgi:hypothetical protein